MLEDREGGCHCGRVRFRAQVDLDLLSQCNCTICTKKGILHLSVQPENFELLRGKHSLTIYTFGTGVAQHTFCSHLRNARVLCTAVSARPNHSQRALPRPYRRTEPQTRAIFRRPSLGGSPAQTDCRRRTRHRCRIERGGHTKENSGPRSGIDAKRRRRRQTAAALP